MSRYSYHSNAIEQRSSASDIIDFRSDTVTQPDEAMRLAMANAPVGDDVYGEDPTVTRLEEKVASLLEKEAAVLVPSGTMSNLCAMLSHCQRGEEIIIGDQYHIFSHEAGGASALGGIVMQPLRTDDKGGLTAEQVEAAIRPDDSHNAISKLVSLENTVSGMVQSQEQLNRITTLAHQHGLSTHLDGARVMNAAIATGLKPSQLAAGFDSVSLCLSKGLGAPAGSVLSGSKELISRARRWRKMLGGGMRQSGVLAAAGLHALEHNVERLAEDHQNARNLAEGLATITEVEIQPQSVETNMLFIRPRAEDLPELQKHLEDNGIIIRGSGTLRLVLHRDISADDCAKTIQAFKQFYSAH